MVQCVVKAKEIRLAAQDPKAFDSEQAPAFLDNIPAFAALLSIIEGRDALDDDKFAVLDEAVTTAFGRTLAVAAARGKLTIGAAKAPAPAPVCGACKPHRPQRSRRLAPRPPRRLAPARPGVLTSTPAPVPAAAPSRNIIITETRDEPLEAIQARESGPAQPAQPAEQAPHDEAAQWWVSAVGALDEVEGHARLRRRRQGRARQVQLRPQRPDPEEHGLRGRPARVRLTRSSSITSSTGSPAS